MKRPSNFNEIMDELRREHRAFEAPRQLEMLLSAETERRGNRLRLISRPKVWAWGLSLALLAGLVWGAATWQMHWSHAPATQQTGSTQTAAPSASPLVEAEDLTAASPKLLVEQPLPKRPRSNAIRTPETNSREASMDDFVPLPASEGLPPASAISLVRMQIQQNALQQYGLEVPAGTEPRTLLAEFAVGEDGLPRAIRIIP